MSEDLLVYLSTPYSQMPRRGTPQSAGLDLFAIENETLQAHTAKLISTGIQMELPEHSVGLIWPRSGLASKHRITVDAGVIDEDYRGEIKVLLVNDSDYAFGVFAGMRIAQLLVIPIIRPKVIEANRLSETERAGGFGSTGLG